MTSDWFIVSHFSSEVDTSRSPESWPVDDPQHPDSDNGWCYYSIFHDQMRLALHTKHGHVMFYIAVRSVK